MLKLSKKVEYGLISLVHMDSRGTDELISAKGIAEFFNIPGEVMGKVLQILARHNLVESVQGAKGGYRLAKAIEDITLGDVTRAIDGPIQLTLCQDNPGVCGQECTCNIRDPLIRIQSQLEKFIHNITLSSFRRSTHIDSIREAVADHKASLLS